MSYDDDNEFVRSDLGGVQYDVEGIAHALSDNYSGDRNDLGTRKALLRIRQRPSLLVTDHYIDMERSRSRVGHRKSRKGCLTCKRRHVKCDEATPSCTACERLGLRCIYKTRTAYLGTEWSPPTSAPPASLPGNFDLLDLQLLHHYTTCCCIHVPGEHAKRLWTHDMVAVALKEDYLLYQLLAVSALHCHMLPGNLLSDYLRKASFYRDAALQQIRPVFDDLTAARSVGVFGFAGLAMIYSFAELPVRQAAEGDAYNPVSHLIECLRINRGIASVVIAHRSDIEDSWAGGLLRLNSDDDLERLRSTRQTLPHVDAVHRRIDQHENREAHRQSAHGALTILAEIVQILIWRDNDHVASHLVHAWTSNVQSEFWELLEEQSCVTLVLLLYFAVIMSLRPRFWWFASWPALLLSRIESTLGADWEDVLEWPRHMISMQDNT